MKPQDTLEGRVHVEPRRHSHMERGCALMNMLIREAKLPDSWLVDFEAMNKAKSYEPVAFGVGQVDTHTGKALEAYMIGLALAAGVISIGKAREFLSASGFPEPHELASFGGAIRNMEPSE